MHRIRGLSLVGIVLAVFTLLNGCNRPPATLTILHFSDVYEIEPVGGAGGLARVGTVLEQLRRTSPPVMTTVGGDFLGPSALGVARVDGQLLGGRQMVAVLNALGVDWVTFGHHEFDGPSVATVDRLGQPTLTSQLSSQRVYGLWTRDLSTTKLHIVSSNVTDEQGLPLPNTVASATATFTTRGRTLRIGLIGLTVDSNRQPWLRYLPPVEAARAQVTALSGQTDAIVALTHQSLAADTTLVEQVPEIDVVLGGHEHQNWLIRRGPRLTPIVKVDANVRTVAVVTLSFAGDRGRPTVTVRLEAIDEHVPVNGRVNAEVKSWTDKARDAFKNLGFDPTEIVARSPIALDGRADVVRNEPTAFTDIIVKGMLKEVEGADVALCNAGAIRVDDIIGPGVIQTFDVIRALPFGGNVLKVTMKGQLLLRVLQVGEQNRGTGGYLMTAGVSRNGTVLGLPIDPASQYTVAISDFLLTGAEANLAFLTRTNPDIIKVAEYGDIRRAVIRELKARFPQGSP